jgi:hypothetical protein
MEQRKERDNGIERMRKRNKEVRGKDKDFTIIITFSVDKFYLGLFASVAHWHKSITVVPPIIRLLPYHLCIDIRNIMLKIICIYSVKSK